MACSWIILLVALIFLALLCPSTLSNSNNTDYLVLSAFKNAIHDPLGALNSWNINDTHFCNWKGIQCGKKHLDRVVGIKLASQGLQGSLSPSIGNLSFLQIIDLHENSFDGIIPNEIGYLWKLKIVDFSNNSFHGEIPRSLFNCSNLLELNLIDNHLTGSIPVELSVLYKIQDLSLSRNNLSGSIPPSIGNLTSLKELSISDCNLRGEVPSSLGNLRNMVYLLLHQNNLVGRIPSSLFNISSILAFEFNQNQLVGSIPSTIGLTLPNLIYLYLSDNQFSGPVPDSISNASSLEILQLNTNYLSGKMPTLGRLSDLRRLHISDNPIRDDIINIVAPLVNCTKLEVLQIGDGPITGVLPNSIANLSTRLVVLEIQNSEVHGNVPPAIGNLIGLTHIYAPGNNLDGFIPSSIGKLSNLGILDFSGNRLSGELPISIGNLTSLTIILMNSNQLSGSIPTRLGHCTNLLKLDISSNMFSGPIPSDIMNLSSLSVSLNLSFNSFTSSIPFEIRSLTFLSALDLSHNRLYGAIPSSIRDCINLVRLELEGNLLEGEVLQKLIPLKGLMYLDISNNHFSGLIPSLVGNLQLQKLNLSHNQFRGEVPKLGVFSNKSAISLEGNRDLCGGIQELRLPPCHSPHSAKKLLPTLLKTMIPIGAVLLFLGLVTLFYKKRNPTKDLLWLPTLFSTQFPRLSYADLLKATNGFSESNLIGLGRFGSVYKGVLNDGKTLIAVKVLNLLVQGATKSFMNECKALGHIRHRNLLKILNVCESVDFKGHPFKALIYEFKMNGSLEKWLYPNMEETNGTFDSLGIIQRLNIAIDIAHALEYLHCGTESTIIHGDLKPSNVLLDCDITACVGDFGLAKVFSNISSTQINSSSFEIKGTIGYVPPEYGMSNFLSMEGDIYSYGILLLEMFTTRRPTDNLFKDHLNIHNFVLASLPDGIAVIADPFFRMSHKKKDEKVKDVMASALGIGLMCSKENPNERISITEALSELCRIKDYYLAN